MKKQNDPGDEPCFFHNGIFGIRNFRQEGLQDSMDNEKQWIEEADSEMYRMKNLEDKAKGTS